MRLVVALLATASLTAATAATAHAQLAPKRPVVWNNRVIPRPAAGTSALANVSHKLYLNDCKPNGCAVSPGADNSLTNRSSIPIGNVVLNAYPHGISHWSSLVQCVRDTFLPFDVEIVTNDPGPGVAHFEVMIGGDSTQLHPQLEAGGVAPFIACGATENNIISFVFPEGIADLEFLCGAVAQEASHVWGLDHELNADDPMTYLELGSSKRFQNEYSDCGESLSQPRECFCGGAQQNSYQYLADSFGLVDLDPASLAITTPASGAWVKPGFAVRAEMTSQLSPRNASLSIDNVPTQASSAAPFAFNAPTTLAGGDHTITVTATDAGAREVSASVDVHVTASCSAAAPCPSNFHCLGGFCLPGGDVAGGLGAACTTNDECITGSCGSDGSESLCTGPCDTGSACPSGFECVGGDVCWPGGSDGGCGAAGGSPGLVLFGAAALAAVLGRRRRRR